MIICAQCQKTSLSNLRNKFDNTVRINVTIKSTYGDFFLFFSTNITHSSPFTSHYLSTHDQRPHFSKSTIQRWTFPQLLNLAVMNWRSHLGQLIDILIPLLKSMAILTQYLTFSAINFENPKIYPSIYKNIIYKNSSLIVTTQSK